MKRKLITRILSIIMPILLIAATVPSFAINASAADNSKYLFAYFTGNSVSQQKIRFATSEDGLKFSALNGGNPTVTQKSGTQCARDPYVFYSTKENCYYLLATDYDYSSNNWGDSQSTMTVWKSNDLITWTGETHIDAKNIPGITFENNLWAPQALWDESKQQYMVYYSTTVDSNKTVVYSYTTDLMDVTKYSAPVKISDFSFPIIDADITKVDDQYVMFCKYEGQSTIYASVSDSANSFSNPVKIVSTNSSTAFEGPQLYKTAKGYNLALDNFSDSGNVWVHEFNDTQFANLLSQIKSGTQSTISIASYYADKINQSSCGIDARHGSFVSLSDDQYTALNNASFNADTSSDEGAPAFGINGGNLIARYLVNDATTDTTAKNSDLTNNGGVSWDSSENAAKFTKSNNAYLSLSTSMLADVTENGFTVSLYAKPSSDNTVPTINAMAGRFFEFTTNTALNSSTWDNRDSYSYISVADNGLLQVSDKNYANHISADPGSGNKYYNAWHLYTVSVSSSGITVYIDGVKSATTAYNEYSTYNFVSNLASCNLLIAATGWPDGTYDGYMKDFRVYNKAITDDEASKLVTQYELDDSETKKQYVSDNIDNIKSYTFDTKSNNADDNYMKNIVYANNFTEVTNNKITVDSDDGYNNFKVISHTFAVGVYSGPGTDIRFPLMAQNNSGKDGTKYFIGIDHVAYSGDLFAIGDTTWHRTTSWDDFTDNSTDTSHDFSSSATANVDRTTDANNKFYVKDTKSWKNYMKYNGTGNTADYYDVLSNPTYAYQADYAWSWWVPFQTKWSGDLNKTLDLTYTNSQNFYVLNYQPLKELLEGQAFKDNFNNVKANEWMYDETSLAQYYIMYYNMLNFDLSTCDLSTAENVKAVAAQMKSFVENYKAAPDLKKITVEYTYANGTVQTKTINAGEAIGDVPANTAVTPNNDDTHSTFAWSETFDSAYVPHEDVSIHEVMTIQPCDFEIVEEDGVKTSTCTVCNYTKTELNLNKEAYIAAVASANLALENTAKYTQDSRDKLQSVLDTNSDPDSAQSQSALDNMTAAILSAIEALELNSYKVNLYYVIGGNTSDVKDSKTVKYGDSVTLNAPEGNYVVEKWMRTNTADSSKLDEVGGSNTSLTGRVVANADYYVYLNEIKSNEDDSSAEIVLEDQFGRVADNMYVTLANGEAEITVAVDSSNKTVTVNGTELKAMGITFYRLTGFKMNGQELSSGTYTVNGKTVITAVYEATSTFNIVSGDDSCTSNLIGGSAYWNQNVIFTAAEGTDSTAWFVNDVLVGYGKTYSFRANADATVICKNDAVADEATATVTSLTYHQPTANTITAVAQYYLPIGCTFKEAGVLLKTTTVNDKDAVDDINNYTDSSASSKAKKFVASKFDPDTNQYMVTVYSPKYHNPFYVGAVAYVTYTDANGNEKTAYSKLATTDYKE